jgi:hypothetical protein
VKRFPRSLEDLLKDKRHVSVKRYLRRIYRDPLTGASEWGLIAAPDGGIMGVHSLSEAAPLKTGGFLKRDIGLAGASRYSDWRFVFDSSIEVSASPAVDVSASPPANVPASPPANGAR